jgi:hypothetical protein
MVDILIEIIPWLALITALVLGRSLRRSVRRRKKKIRESGEEEYSITFRRVHKTTTPEVSRKDDRLEEAG